MSISISIYIYIYIYNIFIYTYIHNIYTQGAFAVEENGRAFGRSKIDVIQGNS